jgi:signal transduction histidine kinase
MTNSSTVARRRLSWRPVSRWWLGRSARVKGLTVVAIPMFALVAVTGASLSLQRQQRAERSAATAANLLAGYTAKIVADAADAETGVRGYVASGDLLFLAPYDDAVARLDADLRDLQSAATADLEKTRAAEIVRTANEVFAELGVIRRAVTAGASKTDLLPELRAGKTVTDQLRLQSAELARDPLRLVAEKRAAISRLETTIERVQVIGLGLGLLAGFLGIALFTSGIARRVRRAADNADRLGLGEMLLPSTPSADELGQLGGSLTRTHDLLTDRLADLSAARDQALRATLAKNVFLSRTSHELRTPLNAILGFAQLLEMSELGPEDRDSAERIVRAGRSLLALINDLIDVARVESGELRLSLEPVLLRSVVDEVADLIAPLAASRGITVERHQEDPSTAARADRQRLQQVMINLASNAVKYNHHGGMIRIGYRTTDDDQVELSVADTGRGLSPEEVARAFVTFERLDAELNGIEGTGIGLPLAMSLTEAMQARSR